jgi:hypothetical protein
VRPGGGASWGAALAIAWSAAAAASPGDPPAISVQLSNLGWQPIPSDLGARSFVLGGGEVPGSLASTLPPRALQTLEQLEIVGEGTTAVEGASPTPFVLPGDLPEIVVPDDAPRRAPAARILPVDVTMPDVVAVGDASSYFCTGTLVAPRLVLTARHCPISTRVLFGSTIGSGGAVRVVDRRTPDDDGIDAALLVLKGPAPAPPRLRRTAQDATAPHGILRLAGFGSNVTSGLTGFGVKRRVDVPVSGWGCDGARPVTTGCAPGLEWILPRSGGRDTCDGDSGGPAFERWRGSWRLIGLTSRPLPGSRVRCGDGGIYVRVDRLDAWIEATNRALASAPAKGDR